MPSLGAAAVTCHHLDRPRCPHGPRRASSAPPEPRSGRGGWAGGHVTFERYGQLSSWPGPCRARGGGRDLPPLRQAALPTRCNRLGRRPSAPPKNKRGTATQRPGSADHAAHGAHTILAVPRAHPSPYLARTNFNTVRCLVQWSNAAHYWRTACHFEANMESQHGGRGIMRVQPVVLYVLLPTSWSGRIYVHCIIFVWRDTSEPARRGANCTSEPVLVVGWA